MKFIRYLYRKYYDFPKNWGRFGWEWEEMKDWYINGEKQ
jgi:hypothetical protein